MSSRYSGTIVFGGGFIVLLVVAVIIGGLINFFKSEPAKASSSGIDNFSAVALCETAIKQFSLNADKVVLPWSDPIDKGESWRVDWIQSKKAKLQNQFGAMIDTDISCNVRKSDGVVFELIVDGEKIVGKL